jgi:hypothetical protein
MAAGDFKFFAQGIHDLGNKIIDMDTDTIKFGLVTNSTVPTVLIAAPCWGAGGSTNFSSTQVATATSYTGPITLASVTWTKDNTGAVFDAADPSVIAQDAGGATNIAYAIFYSDTATNKNCIGYMELSTTGAISLVAGSLTITFNASGIGRFTQS